MVIVEFRHYNSFTVQTFPLAWCFNLLGCCGCINEADCLTSKVRGKKITHLKPAFVGETSFFPLYVGQQHVSLVTEYQRLQMPYI